ncbi:MAG: hypothetical protein IJ794_18560, partial [Lachnospiraceae bacterium]|nr:hypothetical protein [Lachnospiraceae bacterium]
IGGAEVNEISRRLMNWHLHRAHETNCLFLASVIWLSGFGSAVLLPALSNRAFPASPNFGS